MSQHVPVVVKVVWYVMLLALLAVGMLCIADNELSVDSLAVGGLTVPGFRWAAKAFLYPVATIVAILLFSAIDSDPPEGYWWLLLPLTGLITTLPIVFLTLLSLLFGPVEGGGWGNLMGLANGSYLWPLGGQGPALLMYFVLATYSAVGIKLYRPPVRRRILLLPILLSCVPAGFLIVSYIHDFL